MKTYEFTGIASGLDPTADGARDINLAKDVEEVQAADRNLTKRIELLREELREAALLNEALRISGVRTMETALTAAAGQERRWSAQQSRWPVLRAASTSIWSRLASITRAVASIASFGATKEAVAYPFPSNADAMSDDWSRVARRLHRTLTQVSE
jgi:hypothetical protein